MRNIRVYKSLWSGFTHARSQGVLPEVIVRKGLFWQSSPCLMGNNHIFYKVGPSHVRVSKRFRQKPLVWFYRFFTVTHVTACPIISLAKLPPWVITNTSDFKQTKKSRAAKLVTCFPKPANSSLVANSSSVTCPKHSK